MRSTRHFRIHGSTPLTREDAPWAEAKTITRVHPAPYVAALEDAIPKQGKLALDHGDTVLSPGTWATLMHAVGGATRAVDSVMVGQHKNAFVQVRPPGHHAEITTPDGVLRLQHGRHRCKAQIRVW